MFDGFFDFEAVRAPIILFIWRKPSWAIISRTSSAIMRMS